MPGRLVFFFAEAKKWREMAGWKEKTSASKNKTDASKQNEKPTLNKSFYACINRSHF
jgi:hypothetical protein